MIFNPELQFIVALKLKVTNDLLTASDSGLLSVLFLLDLSPSFDTIDQNILLECRGHTIDMDRVQFVHVSGASSTFKS